MLSMMFAHIIAFLCMDILQSDGRTIFSCRLDMNCKRDVEGGFERDTTTTKGVVEGGQWTFGIFPYTRSNSQIGTICEFDRAFSKERCYKDVPGWRAL